MGLLNNVLPFSLIFWGQTQIASGLASILNATTPLFTLLFAGVALLIGPELLLGGASCGASWLAWARPFPMPSPASTAAASRR
jgi:drug/metabolite transporter (DMT)-like permease